MVRESVHFSVREERLQLNSLSSDTQSRPRQDEVTRHHQTNKSPSCSSSSCHIYSSHDQLCGHTTANTQAPHHSNKSLRLVKKTGHINVVHTNRRRRYFTRYIADIFTTLVDLRWRVHLLILALFYLTSWLIFGILYYGILILYDEEAVGDVDPDRLFASAFLFSLETQTTIGYGNRHTSASCPLVIVLVMLHSVYGVVIEAYIIGALLSKLTRAKKRAETILFSKSALINRHKDGENYLMFRVGNLQKSPVLEATIKAFYVSAHTTEEKEYLPMRQVSLPLNSGDLFLTTPQFVTHHIDRDSPLWEWRESRWWMREFEIVVVLEGVVAGTGNITQARTSYLPGEISWGHRFLNVVSCDDRGAWKLCLSRFHVTEKFQNIYEDDDGGVGVSPSCDSPYARPTDSPKIVPELRRSNL